MSGLLDYIISEFKGKKLSKQRAAAFVRELKAQGEGNGSATLHPLLGANTSHLARQAYATRFSGGESFLADHRIRMGSGSAKVLPGAAYLEMARAACTDALRDPEAQGRLELGGIVWSQPLLANDGAEVEIELTPDADGALSFRISSAAKDGSGERTLHCQGQASLQDGDEPSIVDLTALKAQMAQDAWDSRTVYETYDRLGLMYGPSHRTVHRIFRGKHQLLAELILPTGMEPSLAALHMHPSLVDGAFQASIGLMPDLQGIGDAPPVPFALASVRIFAPCRDKMYAWIRPSAQGGAEEGDLKIDLDLIDAEGKVCLRLQGFWSRVLRGRPEAAADAGTMLAAPAWHPLTVAPAENAQAPVIGMIWCGWQEKDPAGLSGGFPDAFGTVIAPGPGEGPAERFRKIAAALFQWIKERQGSAGLVQVMVEGGEHAYAAPGIFGLLRSLEWEQPGIRGQVILVEPGMAREDLRTGILQGRACSQERMLRIGGQGISALRWEEISASEGPQAIRLKENGTYLITGGLGGLGQIFAREIRQQVPAARIYLTGRSELDQDKREILASLQSPRGKVEYRRLDLNDLEQVRRVLEEIRKENGGLDGIIHSAGMNRDGLVAGKSQEDFLAVLEPKVAGTWNLDQAGRDFDLDFLVLFSSLASVYGNAGQADYAMANGFLDGFAELRNEWVRQGKRKGRTLSINWPLWKEGGMQMDEARLAAMRTALGMEPMSNAAGVEVFHRGLEGSHARLQAVAGNRRVLRKLLEPEAAALPAPAQPEVVPEEKIVSQPSIPSQDLGERTLDFLKREIAAELKVPLHRLDPLAGLDRYGINSIVAMNLTARLEKTFGPLSKTLLFERQTVQELREHFLSSHREVLERLFAASRPAEEAPRPSPAPERKATAKPSSIPSTRLSGLPRAASRIPASPAPRNEPIAIIGLSGRYPGALDVGQYWHNLREGKDCITEIPLQRWDWREFYSEDRSKPGHHYSKWGGFIEGVDEFDPLFFGITPWEAELMDPQERLFLQHAWMALEDAGYSRAALQIPRTGSQPAQVGVYAGVMYGEYNPSGSVASIANRVSYTLNLHGPCMTVDTMCSSSLTAIHLASQDLKSGRTDLGIAGGVNVTIHPGKYGMLSMGQFISGDGHCQSFGEGGDGYIPGEGVGVVLLKRLSDAIRDHDHIHAVLRGSAVNHGGKTNGFTVPNPQAQADAILQALRGAGVEARKVGYIEAHGTGTKLGDPIEIAALAKAFQTSTRDTGFCRVGSAKSNIGHCESAAGIAGLTKVLLQMKHGEIVPSLHSTRLNPDIDFASTPFVVNQTLMPWERAVENGRALPRISGLSSFGAGGSNAHFIIEEYPAPQDEATAFQGEVLIPLSARTKVQLKQKAADLLRFLARTGHDGNQAAPWTFHDLVRMAYTLQVGREHLSCRLGLLAESAGQLAERLQAYLDDKGPVEGAFEGMVEENRNALALFHVDKELQDAVGKWIEGKKHAHLLELWTKGLDFEWTRLHGGTSIRKMSLPAYPFARERYWKEGATPGATMAKVGVLHPLVHANRSDFTRQQYHSDFSGNEWLFQDHRVGASGGPSRRIMPAVAYLEMARAALADALPGAGGFRAMEILGAVWARPLDLEKPKKISVQLDPRDDEESDFQIIGADDAPEAFHCQGRIRLLTEEAVPSVDLGQIRDRFSEQALSTSEFYQAFQDMGVQYGPGFRAIHRLGRHGREVLAGIRLPSKLESDKEGFGLHPSILDGALQSVLACFQDSPSLSRKLFLPFSLESLRLLAPCESDMSAWVRPQEDGEADVRKFDIDILDSQGQVAVEIRGFTARAVSSLHAAAEAAGETLRAVPEWKNLVATASARVEARQHLIFCELPELAGFAGKAGALVLANQGGSLADRYEAHATACFSHLQKLLQETHGETLSLQLLVPDTSEGRLFSGIQGLLRSACLENPSVTMRVAMVDPSIGSGDFAALQARIAQAPDGALLQSAGGALQILAWKEIPGPLPSDSPTYKPDGAYLITGGLGGLGILFAREILGNAPQATVILTGRGEASPDKLDGARKEIGTGKVLYEKVDLEDLEDVRALFSRIRKDHGKLNGIIHSAGMTQDSLLLRKSEAEFRRVLKPKVTGAHNLDQASLEFDLDFFVLFSSVAGALGNPGQSDYAAANAFMDRFSRYRNELRDLNLRKGRTLAINWPLWQSGGMHVDPSTLEWMRKQAGLIPLGEQAGIRAFREGLAKGLTQVMVLHGEADKLRRLIAERPVEKSLPTAADEAEPAGGSVERMQDFLKAEFSLVLKVAAHELDPKAQFDRFGIDSIIAVNLTNRLEETFGPLPKTLLFENQTLAALAAYLARKFPSALQEKNAPAPKVATAVQAATVRTTSRPTDAKQPARLRFQPQRNGGREGDKSLDRDIAIIGVSGRYPQADNLEEFWLNLREGKDCVTEIPTQRWDYRKHFHPDRNRPGKSYGKWGGFLKEVDKFDPLFFHISQKEAELIDPQERLFLETVWQSIEDAGYSKEGFAKQKVGVYVGAMWGQYQLFGAEAMLMGMPVVTSSSHASIANRVSYFFDFKGPSLALDTMCSSSLTAIHMACEEIRKGGIEAAIAGGVNVSIHPNKYLNLSQGNFIAGDGRCRSFGAGGDGYVPGEGVGAVVLKSLRKAQADGDRILAVIKSGAINHGGKTHGYTVPNPQAQGDLILEALQSGGIDPRTLDYLEAHGTGTALGDPIEIAGLSNAFRQHTGDKGFCPIGSVKSNIGHLESAAGIAALTKVLLQLKHDELAPSLHAEQENPNIDFSDSPFYVQRERKTWTRQGNRPRRIGISSFGAGGSNAHLIVEEFIPAAAAKLPGRAEGPALFTFSAKDAAALSRYAGKYAAFLADHPDIAPHDLAYTLQMGRTEMDCRLAILAEGIEELRQKLIRWKESQEGGSSPAKSKALDDVFYGKHEKSAFPVGELLEGEAGKVFLKELVAERKVRKIARLWTSGLSMDWDALQDGMGRRISLPTYPFARERCWITLPAQGEFTPVVEALPLVPAQAEEIPQLRHFALEFHPSDLVQRATGQNAAGPLILLGGSEALRQSLPQDVVWIRFGSAFEDAGSQGFSVRPGNREDFALVVQALSSQQKLPKAILAAPAEGQLDPSRAEGDLQQGVYSLAWLCQALLRAKSASPLRILAWSESGPEGDPLLQGLTGFFKSLHQENPRMTGKVMEIQSSGSSMDPIRLAGILLSELEEKTWSVDGVRYMQAGPDRFSRLVNRLGEAKLEGSSSPLPLRQGGVYLISGGLGGLGLILAKHLQKTLDARLVLFGRSSLAGTAQARFDELRAVSEHVMYIQADVSRLEDVQETVRAAKLQFGRIDGILHSAGVNRDAFLLAKEAEDMDKVIRPKVLGALNLDKATQDEDLDLFVLFSSAAGILGNAGQGDYAFGNRFLDACAAHRENLRRQGRRSGKTVSIAWPYWQDGGMSLSQKDIERNESAAGIVPLPTPTGIESWERILRSSQASVMPLYGLAKRMDAKLLGMIAPAAPAPAPATQALATSLPSGQDWTARTLDYLQAILAEQTKIAKDRLDPRERFEAFGIDSVMVGGINAVLEKDLGALPKTLFYEYSTLEELAEYLVREAGAALQKLFGEPVTAPVPPPPAQVAPESPAPTQAVHSLPRSEASHKEAPAEDAVAIIGIHARLPQAEDLDQFWSNLEAGRDAVAEVPADRWDYKTLFDADPARAAEGKIYCKWGAFLDRIDQFDPEFFGIPEQEARIIDPQERLALQSVWSALEDAGYTRETLRKLYPKGKSSSVGVFYGVTTNSYQLLGPEQWSRGNAVHPNSMPWSIPNRISYFFDFQGPSLPVDSACSSTSVAIHMACESLRRGESRIAVAGGVNLYLHPSKYQSFCQRGMISRTGKTCSFGAGDEGFVPGEGVGSFILKPLSQAVADRDRIYAVIRGSAYDHSGRSNGYSAPNPRSQADLIGRVLEASGVGAESISYVEGHGTGTQLGDSVEIAALNRAFKGQTGKQGFCAVGSVKGNVGHAESAAGIAATAKVLLQLRHRKLAPSLHSENVNPNLDLDQSPFYLQHGLSEWKASGSQPRRALINSFGAGGVNACLVLEEYREEEKEAKQGKKDKSGPYLFVLSAKSQSALEEYVKKSLRYLGGHLTEHPARIAYTSQRGREAMAFRLAAVFQDNQDLLKQLRAWKKGENPKGILVGTAGPGSRAAAGQDRDLHVLAGQWVQGMDIEWESLYPGPSPRKLDLPAYPFANKRCWIPDAAPTPAIRRESDGARLHPLVAYNASTLAEIKIASLLSDREFYAREHTVNGMPVFPGSGFAELACVAGNIAGGRKVLAIRDLVWMKPLLFQDAPRLVETILQPAGQGAAFQVVSYDEEQERVIHCEGSLTFAGPEDAEAEGEVLPIRELEAKAKVRVDGAEIYRGFDQAGLGYGQAFRTVREIRRGEGFSLARLEIPDSLLAGFFDYILHPSMLDGAFQAVAGFQSEETGGRTYMPFAIDAIEITAPPAPICHVLVEQVEPGANPGSPVKKFHITLMGENGNVFARIRNFYARALETAAAR